MCINKLLVTVIGVSAVVVLGLPRAGQADEALMDEIRQMPGVVYVTLNFCRNKADIPNDPFFASKGSWQQSHLDQWAIQRVGFTADRDSAWNIEDGSQTPVTVAVIDTGLDWNHADLDWDNIWRNPDEIPDNGVDDDANGYVDDVIGWNFIENDNKPWDDDGHGTFVAGIIAAASDNGVGIAGINRGARIMVLKALNAFGNTRASALAEAIFYAARNGARVINISAAGEQLTQIEQDAVNYAHERGAVIVVAAGNSAADTSNYSPAGLDHVITVAATNLDDERAAFSNWGQGIDIAAPGIDVLSLRGRRTDLMAGIAELDYEVGAAYVGEDRRYYRTGGTSFSAPIVSGVASLLIAQNPELTNEQVERMLLQSSRDISVPGVDQYTGYGLLNATAALETDPAFFVDSAITGVEVIEQKGKPYLRIVGSANADKLKRAWIEIGESDEPSSWKKISKDIKKRVENGVLDTVDAQHFRGAQSWTLRLTTEHKNGRKREARFVLTLG